MIDDKKVEDIYKIVARWCLQHNCYDEETIQDLTWRTWCKVKEQYDETKSKLSTYCMHVCKNFYLMDLRKKKLNTVSLDAALNENSNLTLYDTIGEEDSPLAKIIEVEQQETLHRLYENCSYELKQWLNGKTQYEIAKEVGVTQSIVSRRIKKELEKLRKEIA